MVRSNQQMRNLLEQVNLTHLTAEDIPPLFREVAERGWSTTDTGARLLTDLRPEGEATYFDRLAEETSVNGRGMIDWDLPTATAERTNPLLRRCLAYIGACLRKAAGEFGDDRVKAYLSLSLGGLDDDLMTAHVTFCTPRPELPPYIANLEEAKDAAVAEISLADCSVWA